MAPISATMERLTDWLETQDRGGRDHCWPYPTLGHGGYGSLVIWTGLKTRRRVAVHRISYEHFVGPIGTADDGRLLSIDHLCRNRACANPEHLEAVPIGINVLRGENPAAKNKRKTHCNNGHPYSGDNLMVGEKGRRYCRTCHTARHRAWYRRHSPGQRERYNARKRDDYRRTYQRKSPAMVAEVAPRQTL